MPTAKQRVKAEHRKRFRKAVEELNEVMEEVREYIPKANYYLANDVLNLMVGASHDDGGSVQYGWSAGMQPQYQRVAEEAILWNSCGGDW